MRNESRGQNNHSSGNSAISEVSYATATATIDGQQYSLVPVSNQVSHDSSSINRNVQQATISMPPSSPVNQVPQSGSQITIMSGRQEQASLRNRNQNNK